MKIAYELGVALGSTAMYFLLIYGPHYLLGLEKPGAGMIAVCILLADLNTKIMKARRAVQSPTGKEATDERPRQ